MRSRRKEKVNNLIHERISKAWLVKVKVAGKGREGGREGGRERERERGRGFGCSYLCN